MARKRTTEQGTKTPLSQAEIATMWERDHPGQTYPFVQMHVELRNPTKSKNHREHYLDNVVCTFLRIDMREDWMTSGTVVQIDGRLALERVTLEPNTARNSDVLPLLTKSALRSVPLDSLLAEVKREILADEARIEWTMKNFPDLNPARVAQQALSRARRANRKVSGLPSRGTRRPDRFLWELARDYLTLRDELNGKGINAALREHYGANKFEPISQETMRDWLKACEDAGYLTAGHRGRASREAGPKFEDGATKHQERTTDGS